MTHVFGPVPSRRLGRSLGVDPIPFKTCNYNCVYCQLGRSRPPVGARRDYLPCDDILAELAQVLDSTGPGAVGWITIVGSGEPTLHLHLGDLLRRIKSSTSLPLAVITNGSLLYLPEVRADLAVADAVLPTLDAGTEELFRRINRPLAELTFERLIEGLEAMGREYSGRLWVEVMLIEGLNDTADALGDIARRLEHIGPDEVHLNRPTRPPCEPWVEPPDDEGMMRASAILGEVAPVRAVTSIEGPVEVSGADSLADAILSVITRHPLRREEIEWLMGSVDANRVGASLSELEHTGRAQVVVRFGRRFWTTGASFFPRSGGTGS